MPIFFREQLAELTRLGVGLSEFGERTFLLDALPPFVKVSDARRFVLELVDELKAAGQEVNPPGWENTRWPRRFAVTRSKPTTRWPAVNWKIWWRICADCAMPYTCPTGGRRSLR